LTSTLIRLRRCDAPYARDKSFSIQASVKRLSGLSRA
jgi:hypothetical protein